MELQSGAEAQEPVIVLVDTCVWSLALRRSVKHLNVRETRILELLSEIIVEGRARMLGIVRQELLTGIRHKAQFSATVAATRNFDDISLEIADYEEAASIANTCLSAGVAGSTIDFLICAVAARRNWAVLTTDKDFRRYQKHLSLTLIPD
jgi:predicted nucleic acid-binding protein